MTDTSIPNPPVQPGVATSNAYTRDSVEEYLHAVWIRRQELETQIAAARVRTARALLTESRIEALEYAVGGSLVAAYARLESRRRHGAAAEPAAAAEPVAHIDLTAEGEPVEAEPAEAVRGV